ncbi:unnamed protein product [Cutaneotrichosporon oleaginosum]
MANAGENREICDLRDTSDTLDPPGASAPTPARAPSPPLLTPTHAHVLTAPRAPIRRASAGDLPSAQLHPAQQVAHWLLAPAPHRLPPHETRPVPQPPSFSIMPMPMPFQTSPPACPSRVWGSLGPGPICEACRNAGARCSGYPCAACASGGTQCVRARAAGRHKRRFASDGAPVASTSHAARAPTSPLAPAPTAARPGARQLESRARVVLRRRSVPALLGGAPRGMGSDRHSHGGPTSTGRNVGSTRG